MQGYSDSVIQKQVGAVYQQERRDRRLLSERTFLSTDHSQALLPDHIQRHPAEHSLHTDLVQQGAHTCEDSARELNPSPP